MSKNFQTALILQKYAREHAVVIHSNDKSLKPKLLAALGSGPESLEKFFKASSR